ncbi:hypothetical protein [Prosthecobacter sp.]|uniref:hypothetical protein n=1 Tax=Prosthecobacter sp. TaxID=1965333 RepID=UPI0037841BFF
MNWPLPLPNWSCAAGQVLDTFFAGLHAELPGFADPLTLFGSVPIQLCLDDAFTSADADIMVSGDPTHLRAIARKLEAAAGGRLRPAFTLQLCPRHFFRTTAHYLQRAHVETRHGVKVIVPHVRDVLIGKLHRSRTPEQEGLSTKDLRAFHRVRQLCGGHPNEEDVIEDLLDCAPYFRLPEHGEMNHFRLNVEDLWTGLFGHSLDLDARVLKPLRLMEAETQRLSDRPVSQMLGDLRPSRD